MIVRVNVVLNSHCQQQFYSGLRSLHPDDHAPPSYEKTSVYHVAGNFHQLRALSNEEWGVGYKKDSCRFGNLHQ